MYSGRISNCYDSHAHLAATGEIQSRLDLKNLKSPSDWGSIEILPQHKKGDWIIGFGWDQTHWSEAPHRKFLDQKFPDQPVVFSRIDGHVYWLNTTALKVMGWLDDNEKLVTSVPEATGGEIPLDSQGVPTGIFVDAAKTFVDEYIPKTSTAEMQSYLLAGMRLFHCAGFTHVRDMSCSELQWNELLKLEASGLLTLAIEQTFSAETSDLFDGAYDLAKRAIKVPLKNIRPQALKIYYDGALGSEGAYLSQPYLTSGETGLKLLSKAELKEMMIKAWELPLAIAVHTIGDQAVHEVSEVAYELWEAGHKGHLHLEHVELMRPETIQLLKGKSVTCHLQPCHWLTDQAWLKQKVGSLAEFAFPWRSLQDTSIDFYFGSDSPIAPPSFKDNIRALTESAKSGIPKLLGEPEVYHSHPSTQWISNCYTVFHDGEVSEVIFDGAKVYS